MTLHPALQHTRNGDLVMSNQFDSLVGRDSNGSPTPLGAKSWEVLDSFQRYRFKIDRSKRFSDGSFLSAQDYKRSWEESVRLTPKSANSSTGDVLHYLKGFEDFEKRNELSGVKVVDDETLEVSFAQPLRLALDFLAGNRFAAFKHSAKPNEYIGTGNYVIHLISENELELTANPYAENKKNLSEISLHFESLKSSLADLKAGKIDVVGYLSGDFLGGVDWQAKNIKPIISQDALHCLLYLNGMKGRTLEDIHLRQALQWLVIKKLLPQSKSLSAARAAGFFEMDPQMFLPLQGGRITPEEAEALVEDGHQWFEKLIESTKNHPLRVWTAESTEWLVPALHAAGVTLTADSGFFDQKSRIGAYYRTFEPDVIALNSSVVDADPDGIYHLLGSKGAITSPMIQRPVVTNLVEQGRGILDINQVNAHYAKVTRAVLIEVPYIHLGFAKSVSLTRADKVESDQNIILRNQGHFHIFMRK
jgi:ABC-type transport system substrate-binding protein